MPARLVAVDKMATGKVASGRDKPAGPYPGLRAFRQNESDYFCGRSLHRITLLTLLERLRFLAVLGASGSGKSSLVTAGLLPDIDRGRLRSVDPANNRVVKFQPGLNPFRALAGALGTALQAPVPEIERLLRSSSAVGLERALARYGKGEATPNPAADMPPAPSGRSSQRRARAENAPPTLILVVDQFEELFRFAALERVDVERKEFLAERGDVPVVDSAHNEAQEFIDLLAQAVEQEQQPVYVILTMRSDFLHRCETFDQLPGMISANQFLCPQLQREQIADAVTVAAARFGGVVDESLANRILNDLSPETDQLPVLQHALARMWKLASQGVALPTLTLDHYTAVGGLAEAINRHGEEMLTALCGPSAEKTAVADLPDTTLAKAANTPPTASRTDVERIFRCLAEWDEAGTLVRRPRRVDQIVAETGLARKVVVTVVDVFRATGNHWLRPLPEDVKSLAENDVIDLVHESLLRKWSWLAGAMARERERSHAFRRLSEVMVEVHWPLGDDAGPGRKSGADAHPEDAWVSRFPAARLMLFGSGLARASLFRYSKALRQPYEPTGPEGARYRQSWPVTKRYLRFAKLRSNLVTFSWIPAVIAGVCVIAFFRVRQQKELAEQETRRVVVQAELEQAKIESQAKMEQAEFEEKLVFAKAVAAEKNLQRTQEQFAQAQSKLRDLADLQQKLAVYEAKDAAAAALSGSEKALYERVNSVLVEHSRQQTPEAKLSRTLFNAVSFPAASTAVPALEFLAGQDELYLISAVPDQPVKGWSLDRAPVQVQPRVSAAAFARVNDASLLTIGNEISLLTKTPQGIQSTSRGSAASQLAAGENVVCARALSHGRTLFATDKGHLGWFGDSSALVHTESFTIINSVQYLASKEWVLTSSDDGHTELWDVHGWRPSWINSWKANAPVRNATFDSTGSWVLLPAGEPSIGLVSLPGGAANPTVSEKTYYLLHNNPVVTGRFAPTATTAGTPLVATADNTGQIYLWQVNPGDPAKLPVKSRVILSGHSAKQLKLAWAPDGSFLVSGDEKGLMLVWQDPARRAAHAYDGPPLLLPGPQGAVTALTVSPDSRFIAYAGADGTVRIVPLHPTLTGLAGRSFGGKDDTGMSPGEGVALFDPEDANNPRYSYLFDPQDAKAPLGLARRLKPEESYLSARWDYTLTSRAFLRTHKVRVCNPNNPGQVVWAQAVDWGPLAATGSAVDLSTGLARKLGLKPRDQVEISVDLLASEPAAGPSPDQ